jgi:hypothetical protein
VRLFGEPDHTGTGRSYHRKFVNLTGRLNWDLQRLVVAQYGVFAGTWKECWLRA